MEERWDIYDKNKQLTGRTMKRNDWTLKDDEYHLTVLGVIRRSDGKFLITKRVMTKAWAPGWWEVSGGAAQAGEASYDAVLREVKEETGLTISKPQLCGIKNWYDDKDYRYVVLFYKTEHFTGELQSSDEGKVWWENFENLSQLKLATNDMSDMLRVFVEDDLSEFFYYKDGDDWLYDLK